MIFEVLSRYADFCGNESLYHHCYVDAKTAEEVEAIYPHGFLSGFVVQAIEVTSLPKEIQKLGREPR